MKKSIFSFHPFRNMSLQLKITLCIMMVVLIPLAVLICVFSRPIYDMVMADTIRTEQNASSLLVPEIEGRVREVVSCMDEIIDQPYFEEWFYEKLEMAPELMALTDNAADFKNFIDEIESNGIVSRVKIYVGLDKNSSFFDRSSVNGIFEPESNIKSTYWHGIFNGGNYGSLFCPEYYLKRQEIEDYGNCAYILRTTAYYNGRVIPAYITIYYNNSLYEDIMKQVVVTSGSVSYIINDRNALVVTTDKALSGTYRLKYDDIRASLLASNSFVEREIAGKSVYVASYNIGHADWFLVNVIPKDPVEKNARIWMSRFFVISALAMLLAMVIGIITARSIIKRIAAVSAQMAKVHDGPPVAMQETGGSDEVDELVKTYNYMTEEMNRLIRKQEETAEELRIAEFNALQAQINPHFLYNTMDMINWMAVSGRNKEVSEVVQNLSRFYKLTLSRRNAYSTIENELEHASVYIELQNKRFNDAIDFVVDVPDELMECRLPKLTFQPILENSILHGILETEAKTGTIVLTVWTEGDDIKILISDDGAGMSEDIRRQILSEERIKPADSKGTNVAIVNTHRRLQLLYGDRYGLSYESSPDDGCEVTITIPKHVGDAPYVKTSEDTK